MGLNPHELGSPQHAEHAAVFELVKHSDATHVAINSGAWSDPGTWAGGVVPGNGARVLISTGLQVKYEAQGESYLRPQIEKYTD